jgi:lactam utilization protein B
MSFKSIAVHGDTQGALDLVREIRAASEENQIQIKPMSLMTG